MKLVFDSFFSQCFHCFYGKEDFQSFLPLWKSEPGYIYLKSIFSQVLSLSKSDLFHIY